MLEDHFMEQYDKKARFIYSGNLRESSFDSSSSSGGKGIISPLRGAGIPIRRSLIRNPDFSQSLRQYLTDSGSKTPSLEDISACSYTGSSPASFCNR